MKNNVMLIYPPGKMFQRGEDRCQISIDDSTSNAMRACNDLGYCAAVLEKSGYEIFLMDYQTEKKTIDIVKQDIAAFKPDMIMISTTNATVFDDITFAGELKKISNAVMVLKGAIFYAPEDKMLDLMDLSQIDYLIGGEAETCIDGIADYALRQHGDIDNVHNILYKSSPNADIFIRTQFASWKQDLDMIPFPARKYMNNKLYTRPDTGEAMATIQTSRGCSATCIYCLSPHISGKNIRYRSPENVMSELEDCYYNHNIRNFFFKADTFTMNAEWTKSLCEMIINSPLKGKIQFTANSRTNPISKETLEFMKRAGCFAIAFGFESGSDETLKLVKKGSSAAHNLQAAKWAHEVGIPIFGFFMMGFPWETVADLEVTRRHIFEIQPDFLEVHIVLPYYGTDLYTLCESEGVMGESTLGSNLFDSNISGTKFINQEDLLAYRKKTINDYHLRPAYIARRLRDCLKNPKIFLNYTKFGLRLLMKSN